MALIPMSEFIKKEKSTPSADFSGGKTGGLVPMSEFIKTTSKPVNMSPDPNVKNYNTRAELEQIQAQRPLPASSNFTPDMGVKNYNTREELEQIQRSQKRQQSGRDIPVLGNILGGLDVVGEKIEPAAAFMRSMYTPGAGITNVLPAYRAIDTALNRIAPNLGRSIGGRIAQEAVKEGVLGAPLAAGQTLASGTTDLGEVAKQGAIGAATGAVGGAAISGAGALISKGLRNHQLNREITKFIQRTKEKRPVEMPIERIVQDAYSLSPTRTSSAASSRLPAKQAEYRKQFNQAVETEYQFLKDQMKNRSGVTPGGIIRDQTGEVVDRYGRISNNPVWFQEFHRTNGRNPTNKELRRIAEDHVRNGYRDETAFIPPWKPDEIAEIDNEIAEVMELIRTNTDPDVTVSLNRTLDALELAKNELSSYIPFEGRTASSARTVDGRSLLPRGDGSTTGDIVKRSDIVRDLTEKLNIPVRVGKYREKAHGIFKVNPEVIRTRLANDIPTISHEVGHALDKRYQLATRQFDDEILSLGQKTSAPGYSQNQIRKEGVAEFFRLMLTEPDEAIAKAPKFYQQFATKVPAEVQQVLLDAQKEIQRYINQPVLAKSISEMEIDGKDRWQLPTLDELYTKFVEELHPIRKALKPLGEKGLRVFEGFRLLRGSAGRARAFLRQGILDAAGNKVGKSFEEILAPVRANLDEFRSYIKDKRAMELGERGIMTGSDLTRQERNFNIIFLDEKYPQFRQAHQELKAYQDALLDELVASGVLDPQDMAAFKELNKEYVPFFRDMSAEKTARRRGSGYQTEGSPIKRIKGSDREIIDPLRSIIKNTYQYTAIAQRNKALLDLVDAVTNSDGMGGLVEKIPTPMQGTKFNLEELRSVLERAGANTGDMEMDAVASIFRPSRDLGDNVISVLRNGKREFYELDPDLYLAVTAANQEQMNTITRALNLPTRILRSGIVNTMEFWLKNLFRDQFEAATKTDVGYIPYVDMIRGMYHVLGRTDLYTKFLASGGAQSFRQSLDRNYLQYDLRNILARSMKDKSMNVIKNPLEAMRALSELSETGTRMGIFAKAAAQDSSEAGLRAAAMQSRDYMDFSRKGSIGKLINRVIPFWNAHVQGLDKTIRTFSNPKTAPKALAKNFMYITTPTIGLYQAFKDDPRYQELPQWDKDLFWHFWVGDTHYRLPIPFELGVMFKVIPERLMAYAEGQGDAFRQFGETAFDAVNVIPWPEDIALLSPWIQAISNKTFTGAPIVPRRQQDLLPEDQVGPYTSSVAKVISKIPGVKDNYLTDQTLGSPRKVDHIIQGYTGSLGKYATQVIDAISGVASNRPERPSTGLADKAFFKGFMGRGLSGRTDSIDRFYDRYNELGKQYRSARKKPDSEFADMGEYKQLEQIARSMSELAEVYRAIEADPVLTSKEKTEQIKELNLTTNNLARLGLGLEPLTLEDFYPSMKK